MFRVKVAVIMGGRSSEREVSLRTGAQISRALQSKGHDVVQLDLDEELFNRLRELRPVVAYIALHGRFGEDGTVQGLLELLGIPYVGSGVLASALGMDKVMCKKVFASDGIPVPRDTVVHKHQLETLQREELVDRIIKAVGLPLVVKPNAEGSTVGVSIVKTRESIWSALVDAFKLDETVLIEEFVSGREITVAVIGNEHPTALPVIEIVPKNEFYDYEAKYTAGMSEHIIPARITGEQTAEAQRLAVEAFRSIGCRGFARVDFIVRETDGRPIALEINTLPGMTETSLVPDAARAAGVAFPDLVEKLLRYAVAVNSD
jgi:D-alanine-D-alanine ligase